MANKTSKPDKNVVKSKTPQITLVCEEYHQVVIYKKLKINMKLLSMIYPELSREELITKRNDIINGKITPQEIYDDFDNARLDSSNHLDWDNEEEDWVTSRKGDVESELSFIIQE